MKVFIIVIIIFITLLIVWGIIENFFILLFRTIKLTDRQDGIKIMHISDVHEKNAPRYNEKIGKAARAEKPDMIFITGDLVSRWAQDLTACHSLLNELCSIAPVYMCMGNHEQSLRHISLSEFLEMMRSTEVKLLRGECEEVNIRGRVFHIHGVEPEYTTYKKDESYNDLDIVTADDMRRMLMYPTGENDLLLAHNPLFAEVYAEWGADMTFSGHIHGGSVRLFGVGILSPERKLFPKYSKGVYDVGKMKLIVSGGVGKLRLFNPPEVNFLII